LNERQLRQVQVAAREWDVQEAAYDAQFRSYGSSAAQALSELRSALISTIPRAFAFISPISYAARRGGEREQQQGGKGRRHGGGPAPRDAHGEQLPPRAFPAA
jgi:hypothetical protein